MKLLILTQKVDKNDSVLGFFCRWIEEFAKHCEKVTVICLERGTFDLPENVKVLSLGKENKQKMLNCFIVKLLYVFRFYKYVWQERKNYDAIFVHMNPVYIVLGGLFWKLTGKGTGLWYVHKSVDFKLRLAEKLSDKIFTASKESFRLSSEKVEIVGHGIEIEEFIKSKTHQVHKVKSKEESFKIITVGRIAPVKNLDVLIEAAEILKNNNFKFEMELAGQPETEIDESYFKNLKTLIEKKNLTDEIKFVGVVPHKDVAVFYTGGDLFVNLSDTGSMDKAVLEAMASGLLVLTSNEAFKSELDERYLTDTNPENIANKIIALSKNEKDFGLVEYVVKNHDLKNLIKKIIIKFEPES